jgi:hypothetical protein
MKNLFRIYFALVFQMLAFASFCQNYQTVNSGRESLFEDEYHQVKALRIDSVWSETDSVLFPFANIGGSEMEMCYFSDGPNWIGSKITIKNNGDNFFTNLYNDTIILKTLAALNDSWTTYNDHNEYIITATVTEIDTMSFLGINDSVKFISFQVYNQELTALDHPLNSKQVIISKNYGFVKLLNFLLFPDFETSDFEYSNLRVVNLIGISNPEIGLQNFDALDIYDFQPGDELHTEDYYYAMWNNREILEKQIYKYIDRTDYTDSVYYTVEIKNAKWETINGMTTYSYWIQTTTEKHYKDNFLSALPDEPIFVDGAMQKLNMSTENIPNKIRSSSVLFENYSDNCWGPIMVDGFFPSYIYYKGLGGAYYNSTQGWGDTGYRALVYYNSGGVTSGTPFVLSEIEDFNISDNISIFYDNSSDGIKVFLPSIDQKTLINIYNVLGICVISTEINVEQTEISSSKMQNGIYLYEILEGNKILKFGKLIKN